MIVIQYRSSDNDGIPLAEPVYSTQQKVTICLLYTSDAADD